MPTMALMAGTGLTTAVKTKPICLFVDSTDVLSQPGTPGAVFGTPIESVVLHEVLGQPATLEFTVEDPQAAYTPKRSADVYMVDFNAGGAGSVGYQNLNDIFRGIITSVSMQPLVNQGPSGRQWQITATGLDILLDRTIIPPNSGAVSSNWVGTANSAIQSVMARFFPNPRISFLDSDSSGTIQPNLWLQGLNSNQIGTDVPLSGKTVRQALEDVSRAYTGFTYKILTSPYTAMLSVDPQGRLNALRPPAMTWPPTSTLGITGRPVLYEGSAASNFAIPAPYNINVDTDATNLVNAVYVRGVDAVSSGWVTDAASISSNGRIEALLEAPQVVTSAAVTSVGNNYLADHQIQYRIKFTIAGKHDGTAADQIYDLAGSNQAGWWHVRNQTSLRSASGYFPPGEGGNVPVPNPDDQTIYILSEMTQRWKAGGKWSELDLSYWAAQKSVGSLLFQRDNSTSLTSQAGGRLQGTLGEVAVRVKAGQPVDSDFDSARDGFIVVDSTNLKMWMRVGGVWQQLYGSGANLPSIQVGTGNRLKLDPQGALARRSSVQAITTSTWTAVIMNATEDYDLAAFHDLVTNPSRFTIPTGWAGTYLVVGHVAFTSSALGTARFIGVGKNGAAPALNIDSVSGGIADARMQVIGIYELTVGDFVEIMVWQDTGGNLNTIADASGAIMYLGELI